MSKDINNLISSVIMTITFGMVIICLIAAFLLGKHTGPCEEKMTDSLSCHRRGPTHFELLLETIKTIEGH